MIPELYDVIDAQLVMKWREEIEKSDRLRFLKYQQEAKEALLEILEGEDKELADKFIVAVDNTFDFIYYEISRRLVLFGIKAGLDMQKAFDEED